MRLKLISALLLLVFSTTILPVAQIGLLLASNTLNEEVHQQAPQILEEKCKEPLYASHHFLHPAEYLSWECVTRLDASALLKEMVPKGPAADIIIPPPKASV